MKYKINCPNCESEFDVSEQLEKWKQEFIYKIDKLIEEMKK